MQTKFIEPLPCTLSGEEVILKGKQLAKLAKDKAVLEEQKKAEASRIKSEIEDKESAMAQLVEEVHSGKELRPIECYERPRYVDMMVDIVRTDLGTVVRTRPMHPNERQTALDMGELPPPASPRPKRKRAAVETTEDAH